jgi:hypothetical protein
MLEEPEYQKENSMWENSNLIHNLNGSKLYPLCPEILGIQFFHESNNINTDQVYKKEEKHIWLQISLARNILKYFFYNIPLLCGIC